MSDQYIEDHVQALLDVGWTLVSQNMNYREYPGRYEYVMEKNGHHIWFDGVFDKIELIFDYGTDILSPLDKKKSYETKIKMLVEVAEAWSKI